jgi:carbonic anhydrase
MVNPILPAALATRNSSGDWVDNAAKESAKRTAKRLAASKLLTTGIAAGKMKVTSAIYDLQTGVISYLDD